MTTVNPRKAALTRNHVVFALTAVVALSMFGVLKAQQAAPALGANASKYNIAVVDISAIFKRHAGFKATMESMKKEMEGIETQLKADREVIQKAEQARAQVQPGSPDYKTADEDVARKMAEFNLKMGRLRKDFLEREAKVYYQTYIQVTKAVEYYAKRQNIGLVLRFNGESVDPNQREAVLREINKPVVFQDDIDITLDVLALLNREQGAAGAPTAQPAAQPAANTVPQTGARPSSPFQTR